MDDLSSRFLQQIIEKESEDNPNNWRNYEVESTEILQHNIHNVAQLATFKETFPEFAAPISESRQREELIIVGISLLVCLCTLLFVTSMFRIKWKRNPTKRSTRQVETIKNLPDALHHLEATCSSATVIEFETSGSIQMLNFVVEGLTNHLVDKYTQLETAEACEIVIAHIDSLNSKILKALDQFTIGFYRIGQVQTSSSKQMFQRTKQDIDRIKESLTEIRNDLFKVIHLDETRYKWQTYSNLKEAVATDDINSVLDYNRLMYEYKDTHHYLYSESNAFIDKYYKDEEKRLEDSSSNELDDALSSLSKAFKRLAIHESQQNGEDFDLLKSSAKSITNGDCDGPISSHTTTPLPTDITSPTESSSSSSSGNGNVNLTVNVPASSTVINAPQVMSPVVASNWLIESEKVKRDAKSKLNERLEGLRRSRKENESRASRWAKQLVEERQREIVASRLMLDQMREQRAARREQSRAEEELQQRQLQSELAAEKTRQKASDVKWFLWVALLSAGVYVAIYSEWDPDRAAGSSWTEWLLKNLRRTCSLVECRVKDGSDTGVDLSILSKVMPSGSSATVPLYLAPFAVHNNHTSAAATINVVSSVVTFSPMNYMLTSLVPSSISSSIFGSNSEGGGGSEVLWGYGKCVGYFAMRSLVPWLFSRLNSFVRFPSVSVLLVSLYCFSDLLLRMLGGPLQPLLKLGLLQLIIYQLLVFFDHYTTWNLRVWRNVTIDLRCVVLYVIYPLVLILASAAVSCMHNMEQKQQTTFSHLDICVGCVRHSFHSLYVVVNGVLVRLLK